MIAPCPSHESQARKKSRCQGLGCKPQQPILHGRRVKQRIPTIKEVAGETILQHQVAVRNTMSVVSYGCPRAGIPSDRSFLPASGGQRRTDGNTERSFFIRRWCFGSDQKSTCHTFRPMKTLSSVSFTDDTGTRCCDPTSRSEQLVGAIWWQGVLGCH